MPSSPHTNHKIEATVCLDTNMMGINRRPPARWLSLLQLASKPRRHPRSIKRCHFLDLPGEIRNIIYEYALSSLNGAQYTQCSRHGAHVENRDFWLVANDLRHMRNKHHRASNFRELNQLKFVNRQLYRETRALVLRYNDITFNDVVALALFLRSCPTSQYQRLRTFNLEHGIFRPNTLYYTADPEAVEEVFQFCRQAPHVLVRNHENIPIARAQFLLVAIEVQIAARKSLEMLESVLSTSDGRRKALRSALEKSKLGSLDEVPGNVPANFRVFVPLHTSEDEALLEFRNACLESDKVRNGVLPYVHGGLDHWEGIVRDIIRRGI
jgi:hypothetical protein